MREGVEGDVTPGTFIRHDTKDLPPMNPNSEAVYDAEISPLMTQIIKICRANNIPMIASFQYEQAGVSERGAGFCTTRIACKNESKTFHNAMDLLMQREPDFFAFTITKPKPDAGK